MTDHPILFSGPMVNALLEGRKTQTRRMAWRPCPKCGGKSGFCNYCADVGKFPSPWLKVKAGDRLWVRETWAEEHPLAVQEGRFSIEGRAGIPGPPGVTYRVIYRADGEPLQVWRKSGHPYFTREGPADDVDKAHPTVTSNYSRDGKAIYWTPSIHMPRRASRLTLIATADARVERLRDISNDGAEAEGVERGVIGGTWRDYREPEAPRIEWSVPDAQGSFHTLWESLHTKPGERWEYNPELVVLTFRVVRGNIDRENNDG